MPGSTKEKGKKKGEEVHLGDVPSLKRVIDEQAIEVRVIAVNLVSSLCL